MAATLEAHLTAATNNSAKIAIVGTPVAVQRYQAVLDQYPDIDLCIVDRGEIPTSVDADVTIVLGRDNPESLALYDSCRPLKDAGRVVVFGTDERGLTFGPPDWRSLHLKGMFYLASQYLRTLSKRGAYIEFGVFDGRSFTTACHALRNVCPKFVAADSFAGIAGAEENERQMFIDGRYYANEESFRYNMEVAGLGDIDIETIAGDFQHTLSGRTPDDLGIGPITIAHIDADVYSATKLALDFVRPSLVDGALLLFDEYNAFGASPRKGERRALTEWLEENPALSVERYRDYTALARSFIVHID